MGKGWYETRLAPVQKNQKRDESQTTIDFRRSRVNRNIDELLGWKLTFLFQRTPFTGTQVGVGRKCFPADFRRCVE